MKWPLPALLLVLFVTGCYGPGQNMDPFLGRTTIPPPGTGQVLVPGAAQPYYQGNPLPNGPRSVAPVPGSIAPPAGSTFRQSETSQRLVETPGEREYRVGRSVVEQSVPELRSVNGVVHLDDQVRTVAAESGTSESKVRIPLEVANTPVPKPNDDSQETASSFNHQRASAVFTETREARAPARFRPPNRAVEITDLPTPTRKRGRRAKATSSAIRVAFPSPSKTSSTSRASASKLSASDAPTRLPARYAFAPDHGWLRGKLEYLRSKQQWKLRYIPIDGETDEFGGSVVIADPARLGDFQAGDFVAVEGTLDRSSLGPGVYAPEYKVARITRLTK